MKNWQDIMVDHFGDNWLDAVHDTAAGSCGEICKTVLKLEKRLKEKDEVISNYQEILERVHKGK